MRHNGPDLLALRQQWRPAPEERTSALRRIPAGESEEFIAVQLPGGTTQEWRREVLGCCPPMLSFEVPVGPKRWRDPGDPRLAGISPASVGACGVPAHIPERTDELLLGHVQ
jgi:hypothetical protein